ncbi:hypothetical protein EDB80DRAFT_458080 [Ilyonectria destructans]|nr:hypothetical protein EDB80DRAFT_458080 [Ilyonectria destructans]
MAAASDAASAGESGSEGHIIVNLNAFLIATTTVLVFTRLYVRFFMIKAHGWDDIIVLVTFPLVITVSAMEMVMVRYGSGSHLWTLSQEQLNAWFSLLSVNTLLIFLAGCFVRLSILAFLPRFCINDAHMKFVWATSAVTICTTLTALFVYTFACSPVYDAFHVEFPDVHCVANRTKGIMVLVHSIISTCLDVVLFGLPVWIVYTTMIFDPKAIKVILVFSFGFLAVIAGIVKTCMFLTTDFRTDTTYKAIRVCTWNVLEMHMGLWCASFPALQPLLRLVYTKLKTLTQRPSSSSSNFQSSGEDGNMSDLSDQKRILS